MTRTVFVILLLAAGARGLGAAEAPPESRRPGAFAFAQKPRVTRDGDDVAITFAVKDFCDVTVAIERSGDSAGKRPEIVRHLASGVLGANAPEPFQKDARTQTVVWDGKDDQGHYVDDKESLVVRVSLGLKAQLERRLFWSPYKRTRALKYLHHTQSMAAAPEGVYVFDGGNCDHVRLFDHEGNYVRTVYPPPRDLIRNVDGIAWRTYPQDGKRLPAKRGWNPQESFLDVEVDNDGNGVQCMAVHGNVLYLASQKLNRLPLNAKAGTVKLVGPELWHTVKLGRMHSYRGGTEKLPVESIAISPDGKWMYLTGHMYTRSWHNGGLHGVSRMRPGADERPEPFVGNLKQGASGKQDGEFNIATSVACDAKGRVYVTDYLNSRVQIFDESGKHLKNISTPFPAWVEVNPKNGEIYVFSWKLPGGGKKRGMSSRVTRFGPFEKPEVRAAFPLKIHAPTMNGHSHRVTIDFWAKEPVIWLSESPATASYRGANLNLACVRLMVEKGRKLVTIRNTTKDAKQDVTFIRGTRHLKQRLYFDPKHEQLYAGELHDPWPFHCTSMADIPQIDVHTGRVRVAHLPLDVEDMAFSIDGLAHLRTQNKIVRFDPTTWREVPFDYGEKYNSLTTWGVRKTNVAAAITAAGSGVDGTFQAGGMGVSPKGHVFMTIANSKRPTSKKGAGNIHSKSVQAYTPPIYPGRARPWEVHVWDRHGKVAYEDAVPGIGRMSDIRMDRHDNAYVMVAGVGRVDGKRYFNPISCTAFKMKPQTKIVSTRAPLPLPPKQRPDREPDIFNVDHAGSSWIADAKWIRGGVGLNGKRAKCMCPSQSRFALDYFARSFLPEVDRYSVLILDTNGNEILRIGQYGNVDDGMPLIRKGGPPSPRKIGGDEVGIMHVQMLAVQSDRRLFAGDLGNACIHSVRLDYRRSQSVPLKEAAQAGGD
jgi:DNA-binding beta-propeller fold protein YncE